MVTPTCARCRQAIASEDVNVANDVAFCRRCNVTYQLSEMLQDDDLGRGADLTNPPKGAWYRSSGGTTIVGATHRSIGAAIGLLAISLFWNGIVSAFVLEALSGTLQLLGIAVPHWFPFPTVEGPEGDIHGPSLGMTVCLWIFLLPFMAIGAAMIGAFFSCLAGRTEVRIQQNEGVVSSGIGFLSRRRRFDPGTVRKVRIDPRPSRDCQGNAVILIKTDAGKAIRFGAMLAPDRLHFVGTALREVLSAGRRS